MAKNAKGDTIANSAQHVAATVRYLTLHGREARVARAQERLELRSTRDSQAQLLVLDGRPGCARRERRRLNKQLVAA